MHPKQIPDDVVNNPIYRGEVETYNALSKLSDEFYVYYDGYVNVDRSGSAYASPIDFIIVHEQLGPLMIEVKGGQIRLKEDGRFEQYKPSKGKWEAEDPHGQIKKATRKLIATVKSDGAKYWIPENCTVLFPNTDRHSLEGMPQALSSWTLGAEAMPNLAINILGQFPKKSTKPAWGREDYIDMRRRLHNVPKEVKRHYWKKSRSKSKGDHVRHTATVTTSIPAHQAYSYMRKAKQNKAVKWWQIIVLAFAGIITFLVVSWFLPNSFLR
jgi:hypothetical protein